MFCPSPPSFFAAHGQRISLLERRELSANHIRRLTSFASRPCRPIGISLVAWQKLRIATFGDIDTISVSKISIQPHKPKPFTQRYPSHKTKTGLYSNEHDFTFTVPSYKHIAFQHSLTVTSHLLRATRLTLTLTYCQVSAH